jgi:hypothetical protein
MVVRGLGATVDLDVVLNAFQHRRFRHSSFSTGKETA